MLGRDLLSRVKRSGGNLPLFGGDRAMGVDLTDILLLAILISMWVFYLRIREILTEQWRLLMLLRGMARDFWAEKFEREESDKYMFGSPSKLPPD
jgi:hypothetical protein